MNKAMKSNLKRCPLFSGLDEKELSAALEFFDAREVSFRRGEYINTIGSKLGFFGLILDGCIQVYTVDIDGEEMIMANGGPGETFGESLNFLGVDASVYICAVTDTTILTMNTSKINSNRTLSEKELVLTRRFISLLANRALTMNDRIQIMSKLTIRARLTAFFTECVRKYKSDTFELPFDRSDMAVYLGCDRSALSRELSKMKKEGLVDYKKNLFKVSYPYLKI